MKYDMDELTLYGPLIVIFIKTMFFLATFIFGSIMIICGKNSQLSLFGNILDFRPYKYAA